MVEVKTDALEASFEAIEQRKTRTWHPSRHSPARPATRTSGPRPPPRPADRPPTPRTKPRNPARPPRPRGPVRIIPKPHVPARRRARRVPPLDGQRRPMHRVERHHPARPPAEGEPAIPEIPLCLVAQQRMIPPVRRLPAQPRQIVLPVKHRIDPQANVARWSTTEAIIGRGNSTHQYRASNRFTQPESLRRADRREPIRHRLS